ncbi:MAG: DUF2061 domain-containing protein [Gammaproteobacteria bacterium]|nr:DUF2061 domain-containing protein [Gammaproteobacteria bacterium]
MRETRLRSILKALTWRLIASLVTASIVFIITREAALSVSVGILDSLVKIFVYYFHERVWTVIALGKIVHPLAELDVSKELTDEHKMLIRRQLEELGYFDH